MRKLLIPVIFAAFYINGAAQDSIRNSGNLQLHAGASISGFGVFYNASGSQLINGGNLYLHNNLVNDEVSMSAGTGTLILNGSALQLISGTQPFLTFNLTTSNGSGIQLNTDLSVAGVHTFTAGLITSSVTPNYLVYESGATYTGDNDARHVNGWVRKNGTDDFSFPVGDGIYERKIAISSLSATSGFTCHYYKPTFNIFNLMSPLVQVKENEYWQLNKISGGTARITLNWDHSKVPMNHVLVSDILAGFYTASKWTSIGGTASGNVLTTGQVTSSPVSSFGAHTFGYTNFPLPVTLTSFSGKRNQAVSYLNWVTENESQIVSYSVERSFDAANYSQVGLVSAFNSGGNSYYRFMDTVIFTGQVFYRLKITDRDGKIKYSGVVVMSESGLDEQIKVVNPVYSQVALQKSNFEQDKYRYRITTLTGQVMQEGTVTFNGPGGAIIPLLRSYAKGIYHLELRAGKNLVVKKLFFE